MIVEQTAIAAWRNVYALLTEFGEPVEFDGIRTVEVRDVVTRVHCPTTGWTVDLAGWSRRALDEYYEKLLESSTTHDHPYTYGNRIHSHFGVDQIAQCVDILTYAPTSRQAVFSTWDQRIDPESPMKPCMMVGQFLIRDGELNLSVVFRSHHYGELGNPKSMPAYVANMYGLARLMEDTAEKLCVDIGALTCHSMSAHLYVY